MVKRTTIPSSYEERIDILFDKQERDPREIRSSLTLLMREAERNFTNKPNSIWSGVMCLMSGIDLVAKFYDDSDEKGEMGKRFKDYLKSVLMGLSPNEAELVFQARNAFMHSFNLYSKDKNGMEYFIHPRFDLSGEKWQFIVRETWSDGRAKHFELGIDTLYRAFDASLDKLKDDLLTNKRKHFEKLFEKYGTDKPLFEGKDFYAYCNINGLSTRRI